MTDILELLYDVLFHPVRAFRQIIAGDWLKWSLVIFLLSMLVTAVVTGLQLHSRNMLMLAGLVLFGQIAGGLVWWLVKTAVYHLIAVLAGGRGYVKGLLACFGFSCFPQVLSAPLWLIIVLLSAKHPLVYAPLGCLLGLWIILLNVQAIRINYGLSIERSLLVFFVPVVILFVLLVIGAVVFGVTVVGAVTQWMGQ